MQFRQLAMQIKLLWRDRGKKQKMLLSGEGKNPVAFKIVIRRMM